MMRIVLSVVVGSLVVLAVSSCAALPKGDAGAGADEAARTIERAIHKDAWDATGAVAFSFRGMRNHVWDRARGAYFANKGDLEVWLDLWDAGGGKRPRGVAKRAGVALSGDDEQKALDDAWAWFCNDTFWLNPLAKLFDGGATRELVDVDGKRALKVTYGAGGVTPGDSYVWLLGDDGAPTAVKMWVAVLPTKGVEFSWEGWIDLPTGARIATQHKALGVGAVELTDVAGAATLAELRSPFVPTDRDLMAPVLALRSAAAAPLAPSDDRPMGQMRQ